MNDNEVIKREFLKCSVVLLLMFIFFMLIGFMFVVLDVEAAELDQEETTIVSQEVGADEELLHFGYMTEPEEESVTLARIYNVLLTILYVLLINIGRQIIMRCLRKGHVRNGLVE